MSKKKKAIALGSSAAAALAMVMLPPVSPATAENTIDQTVSTELRLPLFLQGKGVVLCTDPFDPNVCDERAITPDINFNSLKHVLQYSYSGTKVDQAPDVTTQAGRLLLPDFLALHRCNDKHGVFSAVTGATITSSGGAAYLDGQEKIKKNAETHSPVPTLYVIQCVV